MRILLAEDERDLNLIIKQKLTSDGYSVDTCFDGEEAAEFLKMAEYDALILDIMMPKMNGIELLRQLRSNGNNVPVLFLTARDSVADRVAGLDSGANDYLVKPFSFEELGARLRAMTRTRFGLSENIITISDLTIDISAHTVKRGDTLISLSAKEFALLEYLMQNQGIVLSREKIENHLWNFEYEGGTNVVDVYISYLRRKIDSGHAKKLIRTVRGSGYTIKED